MKIKRRNSGSDGAPGTIMRNEGVWRTDRWLQRTSQIFTIITGVEK